ncbi:MAG: hypothetical protein LUG99_20345, partial [Lachnospiraceae bacterium]|nr:hypothetical protein [Lachnospiraceae bacterium]
TAKDIMPSVGGSVLCITDRAPPPPRRRSLLRISLISFFVVCIFDKLLLWDSSFDTIRHKSTFPEIDV